MGEIGILNVGAGDTKLTFDKNNPAERIRSARIVTDMLRRGYALLVEHPAGSGEYTRVHEFRADTCEYIIADFDPVIAAATDTATSGVGHGRDDRTDVDDELAAETGTRPISDEAASEIASSAKGPGRGNRSIQPGRGRRKAIPATGANGIAVARSAGG